MSQQLPWSHNIGMRAPLKSRYRRSEHRNAKPNLSCSSLLWISRIVVDSLYRRGKREERASAGPERHQVHHSDPPPPDLDRDTWTQALPVCHSLIAPSQPCPWSVDQSKNICKLLHQSVITLIWFLQTSITQRITEKSDIKQLVNRTTLVAPYVYFCV